MEYKAGANVVTAAGDSVGRLDRVVIDPRTKQVTHLVLRKGRLFSDDRVLPTALVERAQDDMLRLRPDVTRGDLEALPVFEEVHYVMAETGERVRAGSSDRLTPPAVPGAGVVGAPALYWYPPAVTTTGMPPAAAAGMAGGDAAAGYATEVERHIPENTVALQEGARVISADDHAVGAVEKIYTDQAGRATHVLISQGWLFKHHKPVPVSWIERVSDDHITLAVSAELLRGLPDYPG